MTQPETADGRGSGRLIERARRQLVAALRFLSRVARGIARRLRAAPRAALSCLRIVKPGDHLLSPFANGPRRYLWHLVYNRARRARPSAPAQPQHLHVLLCVPWFDRGGSSIHLANVFQRLVSCGVSVTVVATNPEQDAHLTNGLEIYRSFTDDCFRLSACVAAGARSRFLEYLVQTRSPDVILLVGSRLTYACLPALRSVRPQLRVIDHLYNTEGHVASNREFAEH